jgi:protein DEK
LDAVISAVTGYVLQRYKSDELKTLHRVLFGRVGKTTMIKKNLRKFNGFDFDKESDQFEKKKHAVQK